MAMEFIEAIDRRRSRRRYLPEPLTQADTDQLRQVIDKLTAEHDLRIELVVNNGEAFEGFRRSYGMFNGVRNYLGLIAGKDDFVAAEKLGYCGQIIALTAVTIGLGTCWVSGSYDRKACSFELSEGETIHSLLVVGSVAEEDSFKEGVIRSMIHRKTKSVEEMMTVDSAPPDWFLAGMAAVQKAPSAANRQPVQFTWQGRVASAGVQSLGDGLALDLGIAKANFELGAGGGNWAWGSPGVFNRS